MPHLVTPDEGPRERVGCRRVHGRHDLACIPFAQAFAASVALAHQRLDELVEFIQASSCSGSGIAAERDAISCMEAHRQIRPGPIFGILFADIRDTADTHPGISEPCGVWIPFKTGDDDTPLPVIEQGTLHVRMTGAVQSTVKRKPDAGVLGQGFTIAVDKRVHAVTFNDDLAGDIRAFGRVWAFMPHDIRVAEFPVSAENDHSRAGNIFVIRAQVLLSGILRILPKRLYDGQGNSNLELVPVRRIDRCRKMNICPFQRGSIVGIRRKVIVYANVDTVGLAVRNDHFAVTIARRALVALEFSAPSAFRARAIYLVTEAAYGAETFGHICWRFQERDVVVQFPLAEFTAVGKRPVQRESGFCHRLVRRVPGADGKRNYRMFRRNAIPAFGAPGRARPAISAFPAHVSTKSESFYGNRVTAIVGMAKVDIAALDEPPGKLSGPRQVAGG